VECRHDEAEVRHIRRYLLQLVEAWISPKAIRRASVEVRIWRWVMPSWRSLGPSYRKSGCGAQRVSRRMLQSVCWSDTEVRHNRVWRRHVGGLWPFGFGAVADLSGGSASYIIPCLFKMK
jgi:hypothetical protein